MSWENVKRPKKKVLQWAPSGIEDILKIRKSTLVKFVFSSCSPEQKTSGILEKESLTRVCYSRKDLVHFLGRGTGLGSKKIHIIWLETDLEQKHNTCMELYCFNPDDHSGASARASRARA